MRHIVVLTMLSFLLSGCYKAGLYLANWSNATDTYQKHSDVSYGDQSWQKLDVYVPKQTQGVSIPVVVFIYGGGWSSGDKASYAFVASSLAEHGFMTVIADYVKYPEATYPAYQKDAALVSRWAADHIDEFGGDTKNMHLMGHSAGAHIGAMLLANDTFLKAVALKPNMYRSFVGLAGPYAFTPKEEKYRNIFGRSDDYAHMKVTSFINGDEPPMLLLHGADDDVVASFNQQRLADAIRAKGGQVETDLLEGLGHIRIIGEFSATLGIDNEVVRKSIAFMQQHMRAQ